MLLFKTNLQSNFLKFLVQVLLTHLYQKKTLLMYSKCLINTDTQWKKLNRTFLIHRMKYVRIMSIGLVTLIMKVEPKI